MEPFGKKVFLVEKYNRPELKDILEKKGEFKRNMRRSMFKLGQMDPFLFAEEYYRNAKKGLFRNEYQYMTTHGVGRLFSVHPVSLQNIPREIRKAIVKDVYVDVDLENAQPVITEHMCEALGLSCPFLSRYVKDRESIIRDMIKRNPHLNRVSAKTIVLSIMNGGYSMYRELNKSRWIKGFFEEAQVILKSVSRVFPKFYDYAREFKRDTGLMFNIEGTTMHTIVTTVENRILMMMCKFFKDRGFLKDDAVLLFDSVFIPPFKNAEDVMSECCQFIYEICGISINLNIKE